MAGSPRVKPLVALAALAAAAALAAFALLWAAQVGRERAREARLALYVSRGLSREQAELFVARFPTNDNETWLSFASLWARNASLAEGALRLFGSVARALNYLGKLAGGVRYRMVAVDARGFDVLDPRLLTLVTLQGLANREGPNLYVIFKDVDAVWLANAAEDLGIEVSFAQLDDAVKMFAGRASGYVLYDPALPDTINVGTTLCGVYNAVLVHPAWVGWLEGLGVKRKLFDLRGNFSDRVSAYEWAFLNLWGEVDRTKLAVACPEHAERERYGRRFTSWPQVACRDYAVALKLLTVYLDPFDPRERALLERILSAMPNNSMVMGWHGEDEGAYVDLATRHGKFVAVMMHHFGPTNFANPTVWMHLKPPAEPKFPLPPVRPEVLGRGGVYVTFYVTDGDNLQWDHDMISLWSRRAGVPVAWTVSPFLTEVAPYMVYYYAKTMSADDAFVCGPSGAGYVYPTSNMRYLEQYLPHTLAYLERSGLRIVEVLGYSDEAAAAYAEALGGVLLAIKRDYNELPGVFKTYGQALYYVEAGGRYLPVIFGALHFRSGDLQGFAKALDSVLEMYERGGPQLRFNPADDLLGFARKVDDPDSPVGRARYAAPGERLEGAHTYGPYTTLPAGRYKARFLLKIDQAASGVVATIDVCTDIGRTIIASREVHGSEFKEVGRYQWFELNFTLEETTSNVEFRVWYRPESGVGLYCGLIEVAAPSEVAGGLPFVLVVSQPWDVNEWEGVARLLREHSNVTPINLHEFVALVNVEHGYGVASRILEERVKAGKLPSEKAAELRALLDEALSLYRRGSCYEAVRRMIAFYKWLANP